MSLPDAYMPSESREAFRLIVHERGLVGLASDTKWNELLAVMRGRKDWVPSYRYTCVDGRASDWDQEWFYHLPYPMLSVEWMDIGLVQRHHIGRLLSPTITNHSDWILPSLDRIGFDTLRAGDIVRIFGYAPRDLTGLDAL
ncbi:MAG: hypothetical protein Rubg2KO_00720 [Rubricoccaceae bacterium]